MKTHIRIVHNRKLSMTAEESTAFDNLCQSYDRPNFKGIDLFQELFESDNKGNITFIRSPSRQTSMEIFLFICALYTHQGRRVLEIREEERLSELTNRFDERFKELVAKYETQLTKL